MSPPVIKALNPLMFDNENPHGQSTRKTTNLGDLTLLQAYLKAEIPTLATPVSLEQFKLGQSNPTFLIKDVYDKKVLVLRKKPAGALMSKKAHAVEREYAILDALNDTDVETPNVYCLCEDSNIIGTPFYVMEYINGRIFSDVLLKTVSEKSHRRLIYLSMIKNLTSLHKVPPTRLLDSAKSKLPSKFYNRQIHSLSRISAAQGAVVGEDGQSVGAIPELDFILSWFHRNMVQDKVSIMHGDYKLDNIVIHPTKPYVIGTLDWELSTLGHPLADLANMLMMFYIPQTSLLYSLLSPSPFLSKYGIPTPDEMIQYYCTEMGLEYPIRNWDFCIAFAFFRLTVITQGIDARVRRGQASSKQAKRYAALWRPCAEITLGYARKGDLRDGKL